MRAADKRASKWNGRGWSKLAVLGVLLLAPTLARAQCALTFSPPSNYPTGTYPICVASADFNGDGIADLATADYNGQTISILLGNGGGTFQTPLTTATGGSYPVFLAVGDFNGDGWPDVAIANSQANSVSILIGWGNGTFQAPVNYGQGTGSSSIVVADFNVDGSLDLATAAWNGLSVSVRLGNGDGTFQPALTMSVSTSGFIAAADLNADGWPDLLVPNSQENGVSVLLGHGNGTFQAPANYTASGRSVVVGDFNDDGVPDLAVMDRGSGPTHDTTVSVLLGGGGGVFQPAVEYRAGSQPTSIAIGDFNGDGSPDLAVTSIVPYQDGRVYVLLGRSTGAFQAAVNFPVGTYPLSLAVADFNGDGRPDLVTSNSSAEPSYFISVLLNTISVGITHQPTSQLVQAGQSVTLLVTATGSGPLVYQWRKNGTPLVDGGIVFGSTTDSLTITPVNVSDTGSYDVLATAPACGGTAFVTSAAAIVAVTGSSACAPTVSQIATAQPVFSGSPATFSIAAAGPPASGTLVYQWRRNGAILANGGRISGATSPTLIVSPTTLADNGAAFDCVVSNACGSTRSDPVGLGIIPSCPADFNHDGAVTSQDFFNFLAAFFAGCP